MLHFLREYGWTIFGLGVLPTIGFCIGNLVGKRTAIQSPSSSPRGTDTTSSTLSSKKSFSRFDACPTCGRRGILTDEDRDIAREDILSHDFMKS
ncbi:hypothetical protein KBA73_03265 [Patescibacteria group bacterium]|nr:hypothetical protein [Patescibacteria group bacterium]